MTRQWPDLFEVELDTGMLFGRCRERLPAEDAVLRVVHSALDIASVRGTRRNVQGVKLFQSLSESTYSHPPKAAGFSSIRAGRVAGYSCNFVRESRCLDEHPRTGRQGARPTSQVQLRPCS